MTARVFIDTVAWVRLENGRILCARPRGKGIFYIPGGKREGAESDLQTLLREITEELTVALLPDTVTHVGTYEADQPDGHPSVLVRGSRIGELTVQELAEVVQDAWLARASPARSAAWLHAHPG